MLDPPDHVAQLIDGGIGVSLQLAEHALIVGIDTMRQVAVGNRAQHCGDILQRSLSGCGKRVEIAGQRQEEAFLVRFQQAQAEIAACCCADQASHLLLRFLRHTLTLAFEANVVLHDGQRLVAAIERFVEHPMQAHRLGLAEILAGAGHAQHGLLLAEAGFKLVQHVVDVPAELAELVLFTDVHNAAGDLAGSDIGNQPLQLGQTLISRFGTRPHQHQRSDSSYQQGKNDVVDAVAMKDPQRSDSKQAASNHGGAVRGRG